MPPERTKNLLDLARKIDAEEEEIIARARRFFEEHDELMGVLGLPKAERQRLRITLDELSRRTGIGKGNLSKLENGKLPKPTIQTLHRIADALGKKVHVHLA
jgi:DNA-binding Xre family transcriptional regulator